MTIYNHDFLKSIQKAMHALSCFGKWSEYYYPLKHKNPSPWRFFFSRIQWMFLFSEQLLDLASPQNRLWNPAHYKSYWRIGGLASLLEGAYCFATEQEYNRTVITDLSATKMPLKEYAGDYVLPFALECWKIRYNSFKIRRFLLMNFEANDEKNLNSNLSWYYLGGRKIK